MCAVLLQLLLVAVRITATSANFAATAELPDLLTMSDGRHIEGADLQRQHRSWWVAMRTAKVVLLETNGTTKLL